MKRALTLCLTACLLAGCASSVSRYVPEHLAEGELTLRYPGYLQIYAGSELLTEAPGFGQLERYVHCVPEARGHAASAESNGIASVVLSWLGSGLAVGSLGSLGGLALFDQDPAASLGILAGGLAVALAGIGVAAASRVAEIDAHGHAVDAVNYYNDVLGSYGGRCDEAGAPATVE